MFAFEFELLPAMRRVKTVAFDAGSPPRIQQQKLELIIRAAIGDGAGECSAASVKSERLFLH
jgi:RNase P/RNase MRP subunit POP5